MATNTVKPMYKTPAGPEHIEALYESPIGPEQESAIVVHDTNILPAMETSVSIGHVFDAIRRLGSDSYRLRNLKQNDSIVGRSHIRIGAKTTESAFWYLAPDMSLHKLTSASEVPEGSMMAFTASIDTFIDVSSYESGLSALDYIARGKVGKLSAEYIVGITRDESGWIIRVKPVESNGEQLNAKHLTESIGLEYDESQGDNAPDMVGSFINRHVKRLAGDNPGQRESSLNECEYARAYRNVKKGATVESERAYLAELESATRHAKQLKAGKLAV